MSTKSPLIDELKEAFDDLRSIRDEIRVQINLAGKEAKARWEELEPRLSHLESRFAETSDDASSATTQLARDLAKAFRDFRDRLRR